MNAFLRLGYQGVCEFAPHSVFVNDVTFEMDVAGG
jgi:hypothetical protein